MHIDQWVDLAGVIISALGFIIIIMQLQVGLGMLRSNMVDQLYDELHEIHQTFVEYPSLRPYFFEKKRLTEDMLNNKNEKNSKKYHRARSVAEMFFDIFEQIYIIRKSMTNKLLRYIDRTGRYNPDYWDKYIKEMVSSSPFLASYLYEVRSLITPEELRYLVLNCIKKEWPEIIDEKIK